MQQTPQSPQLAADMLSGDSMSQDVSDTLSAVKKTLLIMGQESIVDEPPELDWDSSNV